MTDRAEAVGEEIYGLTIFSTAAFPGEALSFN